MWDFPETGNDQPTTTNQNKLQTKQLKKHMAKVKDLTDTT